MSPPFAWRATIFKDFHVYSGPWEVTDDVVINYGKKLVDE